MAAIKPVIVCTWGMAEPITKAICEGDKSDEVGETEENGHTECPVKQDKGYRWIQMVGIFSGCNQINMMRCHTHQSRCTVPFGT